VRHRRGRARHRAPDRTGSSAPPGDPRQLEADLQWLSDTLQAYSIELDSSAQQRILFFAREIVQWNSRLNLLSRPDVLQVIRKHVAASIGVFLVVQPREGDRWIDVGTGGGFPGLVLRLIRPDLPMTLLDSSRKRALFLENVLRRLDQSDVPVLAMRAETLLSQQGSRGGYSVLMTRAVASLEHTVEQFGPLVSPEGCIVTFKGPRWPEELAQATQCGAMSRARFELASVTRVPWTAGHLLLLRRNLGQKADIS
jgi:16S rRNA (guanine527-N7)-methyltransferase